jgi:hypothetical protein
MSYVMKVEMYHGNQFQMQKMQKSIMVPKNWTAC